MARRLTINFFIFELLYTTFKTQQPPRSSPSSCPRLKSSPTIVNDEYAAAAAAATP